MTAKTKHGRPLAIPTVRLLTPGACCQGGTKRGVAADEDDDDDVCFLGVLCRKKQKQTLKPSDLTWCDVSFEGEGKWFRNIDYYRLDGSTNATTRKKWAEEFNDTSNTR